MGCCRRLALVLACQAAGTLAADEFGGWLRPRIWTGHEDAIECVTSSGPHGCAAARIGSSYGQLGQDLVVSYLLGCLRGGYFIDLAANDAIVLSNTAGLEKTFGWRGVCVEPNPKYWPGYGRRQCDLVGAVVTERDDEVVNFVYEGVKGTLMTRRQGERLQSVSMKTLLEDVGAPKAIDYMSLDVEGAETAVMRGFPFDDGYDIRVLTVERPSAALEKLLLDRGMINIESLGRMGEVVFIKADDAEVATRAKTLVAATVREGEHFYPGLSEGTDIVFPGACGWTDHSVRRGRQGAHAWPAGPGHGRRHGARHAAHQPEGPPQRFRI